MSFCFLYKIVKVPSLFTYNFKLVISMLAEILNYKKTKLPNKNLSDLEIIVSFSNPKVREELAKQLWEYYEPRHSAVVPDNSLYKDMFQEAYIILWQQIEQGIIYVSGNHILKKSKNGQEDGVLNVKLTTLFMDIAHNKYLEWLKEPLIPFSLIPTSYSEEGDVLIDNLIDVIIEKNGNPATDLNLKNLIVDVCVARMPKRCRQILLLFYWKNMDLDDILPLLDGISNKDSLKSKKAKCMDNLTDKIQIEFRKRNLKQYNPKKNGRAK